MPDKTKYYSVRDLKAFQLTFNVYQQACEWLDAGHIIVETLKRVLHDLVRGCHRFDNGRKAEAYCSARDHASEVVCELILMREAKAEPLIHTIEQDLMPAFAALMQRVDKW